MRAWIPPSIIEWAGSIMYLPRSTLCRASSYKSSRIRGSLRGGRRKWGRKKMESGKSGSTATFYVNLASYFTDFIKWNLLSRKRKPRLSFLCIICIFIILKLSSRLSCASKAPTITFTTRTKVVMESEKEKRRNCRCNSSNLFRVAGTDTEGIRKRGNIKATREVVELNNRKCRVIPKKCRW